MSKRVSTLLQGQIDRRRARIEQMGIAVGRSVFVGWKRRGLKVLRITEDAKLIVEGKDEPLSPLPVWSVE